MEALDDGQLRALLDEAITYKCPKDREGKSSLFKVCSSCDNESIVNMFPCFARHVKQLLPAVVASWHSLSLSQVMGGFVTLTVDSDSYKSPDIRRWPSWWNMAYTFSLLWKGSLALGGDIKRGDDDKFII